MGEDEHDALTRQIRDEIGSCAVAFDALIGSADIFLSDRVDARAPMWADSMLGDDDRLAAQTVIDLMNVLWGNAAPPSEWWGSPFGRAVARSVGHPSATTVSYSVAGAMLGCSKQYIAKLVKSGHLVAGPSGGVTSTSVQAAIRSSDQRIGR